jgi:hypothetical protein
MELEIEGESNTNHNAKVGEKVGGLLDILGDAMEKLRDDMTIRETVAMFGNYTTVVEQILHGSFVAASLKKNIDKDGWCRKISTRLHILSTDTEVSLDTYWNTDDSLSYISNTISLILEELYYTLYILHYGFAKRRGKMRIIIFMSNSKKMLPSTSRGKTNKKAYILTADHVNSGFSYIRKHHDNMFSQHEMEDIVIYRKEEVLKVLKHEIIHCMNMHASDYPLEYDNELRREFNVINLHTTGSLNIFEAYVEFIALFLNTMIYTYCHMEDGASRQSLLVELNKNMMIEWNNTIRTMRRIFNDRGITLTEQGWKFKTSHMEETNVFSYYVIKGAFLMDWKYSLHRLRELTGNFALDGPIKVRRYFEFVKRNLRKLRGKLGGRIYFPEFQGNLTRSMRMSLNDRL